MATEMPPARLLAATAGIGNTSTVSTEKATFDHQEWNCRLLGAHHDHSNCHRLDGAGHCHGGRQEGQWKADLDGSMWWVVLGLVDLHWRLAGHTSSNAGVWPGVVLEPRSPAATKPPLVSSAHYKLQ